MTRISVYKLYTKSKALYIPIRQASASLSRKSQTLKITARTSVLSGAPEVRVTSAVSNRATRVIYEARRHLRKTTFLTTPDVTAFVFT